ncbi:hypothetical protein DFA_07283 [Cavenderia fasciculata]|uniref:Nucleoside diphosphate-linked moiety X motif 6 n=1 Tax=Cavenderia fasciculata TaxID=261658 RepID=F4PVZ9_CACFS|nr:uncharacterized protein DFA_07283 [Cavenderia fasciculata]EGG20163.1 hypothetical protein DFA_07283 [Cavenderia fasciculata]|eukprot:XP_004367146.1 hypothetical protein DFA_07283 [Cavenderia fasciculata]
MCSLSLKLNRLSSSLLSFTTAASRVNNTLITNQIPHSSLFCCSNRQLSSSTSSTFFKLDNTNNSNKKYYTTSSSSSSTPSFVDLQYKIMTSQTNTQRLLPVEKQADWRFNTHELPGIFRGIPDIFDGITVNDDTQYPNDVDTFEIHLKNSIEYWVENKRRGVWIKIPESKSEFIPIVVRQGFSFHHCQSDYIMLTKWLPQDKNRLPDYTSHFIGCGGLVINDKKEILLITEKQRPNKWKIPGGALDSGEDICTTAVREVWEETGVKTEFVSVLGFRQLHNYQFNRGDIYFVCALKPLSSDINLDPNEIAQCKWLPIEEFVKNLETFPLQRSISRLAYEYAFNGYKGLKASEVSNSLKNGNSFVYHGSDADFDDLIWVNPDKKTNGTH